MKKRLIPFCVLIGITALLTGCGKKEADPSKNVILGEYTGLTVDRIVTTITDEDVEEEINSELESYAEYKEITDRPAKNGDTVNIDFTGYLGDEELEGGSETDCTLVLGSEEFIEGFEEGIVGMNVHDTKDITITFPEVYDGELDGKEAIFRITLNSISLAEVPELTDDFVKENTEYETVAEYKASLKESLQAESDEESSFSASYELLSIAVNASEVAKYPEDQIKATAKELEDSASMFAEQFGMDIADLYGEEPDFEEEARESLKEQFVVQAIAQKENLTISDSEYSDYVADIWPMYGYSSQQEYEEDYPKDDIMYELIYEKVLQFLVDHNSFIDVPEDEYFAAMEEMEGIDFEDDELLMEDELLIDDEFLPDELDIDEFAEELETDEEGMIVE